jgi:hypothetical protein
LGFNRHAVGHDHLDHFVPAGTLVHRQRFVAHENSKRPGRSHTEVALAVPKAVALNGFGGGRVSDVVEPHLKPPSRTRAR